MSAFYFKQIQKIMLDYRGLYQKGRFVKQASSLPTPSPDQFLLGTELPLLTLETGRGSPPVGMKTSAWIHGGEA